MTLAFLTGFWVVVEAVTLLLLAELAKNELAAPWPREEKYRIWRAPFLLLLKLLLFNKKWRSRHCFALHFDFLKTDRFLLQSVSFLLRLVLTDFFSICFSILFFFCSTHAFRSASQSSRSAAAEATAQRSPQVIFLGIHTAKYSVMSTRIAAVFWAESAQCWGEGLRLPTADSSL